LLAVALVVVVLVAVLVLAARRVALRASREIDPFALTEPWRHHVARAVKARRRFDEAVAGVAPGPLRERLDDVGRRLEAAVEECWQVARRAQEVERATRGVELAGRRQEVELARVRLRELDQRFEEAATHAVEISLTGGDADIAALGAGVEDVVDELGALRAALEETSGG
jgi:hypothetical protein